LHNNFQFDIALYEKNRLMPEKITRRYVQGIPPYLVVAVDLDVRKTSTRTPSERFG